MRKSVILSVIATASLAVPAISTAAPLTYQTAVTANNPYLYYRLQETGTLNTLPGAVDFSANNRAAGPYRGTGATGGAAGAGLLSDTAVSFPGTSVAGLDYLRTTDSRTFGSQVGQSSYELLFKTNTVNATGFQTLFGVFNSPSAAGVTPVRTNTGAVSIDLNSNATGNATTAGTSRFYVRDEANHAVAGVIANGTLLDGNYHQLSFTYDVTAPAASQIMAYVDGVSVAVTTVAQSAGQPAADTASFLDFTVDPTFAARNVRGVVDSEANITLDEAALFANTVLSGATIAAHATAAGFLVPEPTSIAALALGGLMLGRRRKA